MLQIEICFKFFFISWEFVYEMVVAFKEKKKKTKHRFVMILPR